MDNGKRKVVMAQMKPRERHEWTAKRLIAGGSNGISGC